MTPASAQAGAAPMFPFVIPWDDAVKNATDVSFLNPAPLEDQHRVTARGGHFFDQTGRRVRFLGVNLTFSANFPDKPDAEKVAARMHKFGINMVRLHHMDGRKAPMGLWDPNFPDFQHLDADQLDRLDYLVAQFKKNGIYVDLNLHVARKFGADDGFPDTQKLPPNGKVTAWFEPRMVELQKQFAREMLSHRNPYTGQTYAQDPVMALIEIHNEDSMLDAARDGRMQALPDYYKNLLTQDWNGFLKRKYGNTAALLAAWNTNKPAHAENLLSNSQFTEGTAGWKLERTAPAEGSLEIQDIPPGAGTPPGRTMSLKTAVADGTHWHLQANYNGIDLKDGQDYTLKFWARSKADRQVTVNAKMDQAPWKDLGLRRAISLTPEWKQYELVFRAEGPVPQHSRVTFMMGEATGEFWIANVELRAGFQLETGGSLEAGNISLMQPSPTPWGQDATRFLMDVERQYVENMRDTIKQELGARGLVTCSQASYGGLGGVYRESGMDFVDMHAYWQHPNFPGRPWDPRNWNVRNTAMVADADFGTFPNPAMNRVAGKPFTVSEYNHAAPSNFSVETLPLIVSYAAWQDWDGVFLFDYQSDRNKWRTDQIENFFSVDSHPGKIAFLPAAALLFLRGEVPVAPLAQTLRIPQDQVVPLAAASGDTKNVWKNNGATNATVLQARLGIEFITQGITSVEPSARAGQPAGGLQWSPVEGRFSYTSPQAQFAVTKYSQNTKAVFPNWSYDLGTSQNDFAALALASRDNLPIEQSHSLLLTVAGNVENTGMGWNAEHTSVSDKWGTGPVAAEGITGRITVRADQAGTVVYALDASGNRTQALPAQWLNGTLSFEIGPQYKTLWYEITKNP